MGTCIEAVATTFSRPGLLAKGSLGLSDGAARACLERAARRADELDLLVNTGIYKEKNMVEPALASVIQEDIHANPGHPPRHGHHGTFSFDVLNGGCGSVTATHLVDAFVHDGAARLAMIVAADADPSPRTSKGFPFGAVGAAMLLAYTPDEEGFVRHEFQTFPEYADLFVSTLEWDPTVHRMFGSAGANAVKIREEPGFALGAVECAVDVTSAFLEKEGMKPGDVDLVVTSQYPLDFADGLARGVGFDASKLARGRPEHARSHTAGPIAALESAIASRAFDEAKNVLFVTVGAGISVAVALYRRNGHQRRAPTAVG